MLEHRILEVHAEVHVAGSKKIKTKIQVLHVLRWHTHTPKTQG